MPAILPSLTIDRTSLLCRFFTPYQVHWITVEDTFHSQGKQAFILAEKSVRIGWTFGDSFKNVRKRIHFPKRDYLFATKDYPSALEYVRLSERFTHVFNLARSIISHGEQYLKVPRLDHKGRLSAFTDEIKIGVIKFDNGSRIIAFSAHPQAMAVYGGDVGLDEFAKHQNARLLWETAQSRVAWGGDLAIWSAHDGEDTLFHEFALEARAACTSSLPPTLSVTLSQTLSPPLSIPSAPPAPTPNAPHAPRSDAPTPPSPFSPLPSPWNLYYRVTLPDAIDLGLLDVINRTQGKNFTREQFIADCRARARQEDIFQQSYMCNPLGATANHIVEWSAIERCRYDYDFIRLHLEHQQILEQFGQFNPASEDRRRDDITDFIHRTFRKLFQTKAYYRLGFDVAASGQGDLAVIYIDELKSDELWLRALFTCRTEDWHFLQTVLFKFLHELSSVRAAGDASGLGRQICWQAASRFSWAFDAVNFGSKKHDLGFALMNQLATARKRFPSSEQDIAADFFALRKSYEGTRWVFSEGRNTLNPHSHCDIAWAGALASHAHITNEHSAGGAVG